jgi:hypothetical protein
MTDKRSSHRPARRIYRALAALLAAMLFSGVFTNGQAFAEIYGGFSLGTGEEYTDNLYFSTQAHKEHVNDWITHIVPTFSLLYATPGDPTPVLTATFAPEGQIFGRNTNLTNFGDKLVFDGAYTYKFAPKLTFNFVDNLKREGETRTIGLEAMGPPPQLPITPTDLPSLGNFVPLPLAQEIQTLVTKGRIFTNSFSAQPVYQYSPVLTFSGGYGMGYSDGNGGRDFSHSAGVRGVYNWRQEHNLFAGYTVNVFNSGGKSTVVHSFDVGDDFFSNLKIRLSPTWTLSGAFGLAFNTGGTGPAVVNNVNVTVVKVWQNATLNLAIRRGLTTSVGLFSGPTTATTFSAGYGIRLTERLTALAGTDFSLLGEKSESNIQVFRASAGLQYWIASWLSSNLWYSRRWRSVTPSASIDVPAGHAGGNNVLASITAHFDVYPNPGLARGGINRPLFTPMGSPTNERTELQQPLKPELGRPELQQAPQQPLREQPPRPTPPPKPEEAKPSDSETPPAR